MRVGIYNRWLSTLGGGEKHSLEIAAWFARSHQVEYLNHGGVDATRISDTLAVDVSNIDFRSIPELPSLGLSPISRDYDVFINASFMDFFPSLAPLNAAVIYFPAKLNTSIAIRRKLKQQLRKWMTLPSMDAGLMDFSMTPRGLQWDFDRFGRLQFEKVRAPTPVSFKIRPLSSSIHAVNITVNRQPVERLSFPASGQPVTCETILPAQADGITDLSFEIEGDCPVDGAPKLSLEELQIGQKGYRFFQEVFEKRIKRWAVNFQFNPPAFAILDYLKTYNELWAISEYTRRWIQRYWKADSEVLYPLVDIADIHPGQKTNTILNVGRFFAGNHNKKHMDMVRAFRSMVDSGLKDWKLVLAGGTKPDREHQEYLQAVRDAAQGYPVEIRTDIPRGELVRLYAQASIYWHASGYGENENRDPIRFEHFGITTVESMAAGCSPVVIAKGGQPEIIRHGVNGFLWNTLEQLAKITNQLIDDPDTRSRIGAQAVADSRLYSGSMFSARLEKFLSKRV